jgi:hypothetical protein
LSARTLIAILAAVTVGATPVLAADGAPVTGPDPAQAPPKSLDQGTDVGTFAATGRGVVMLRGNLTVYGNMVGTFVVRDPFGTAVVKVNGVARRGRLLPNGDRLYSFPRATRSFFARGRAIRVTLAAGGKGGRVNVSAYGRGRVTRLAGTGTWVLNNGAPTRWVRAVLPILIQP